MTPKQTVEAIYEAFRRGDIPFIVNQCAPDVLWRHTESIPWGGDYHGHAGVAAFFERLNEIAETTGFETEDSLEAGMNVITYGAYSSRNRATGKQSRARFVFRWQFADGKVTQYDAILDSAPIAAAAHA